MNKITKEQIERLEKVGIAIVDIVSEEYETIKKADESKDKKIKDAISQFNLIVNGLKGDVN